MLARIKNILLTFALACLLWLAAWVLR